MSRPALRRPWRVRSLNARLLLPILGLMSLSLFSSAAVFVAGTALTRNWVLQNQVNADTRRISAAIIERAGDVATASDLLAHDPEAIQAIQENSENALALLNRRTVVLRERFGLDLIQVYDGRGEARANLVLANLYRETSVLHRVPPGAPSVQVVDGHALLVSRAAMSEGAGTVVAGIDLEAELQRLEAEYHLPSQVSLSVNGTHVGTRADAESAVPDASRRDRYSQRLAMTLGRTPVELEVTYPTADATRTASTGLAIMVASTLLTTLLLSGLSVLITRSIARPIQHLSAVAGRVAQGQMNQEVEADSTVGPFGIGSEDEITLLVHSFNTMIAQLRGLYRHLEDKVEARTKELATAADVASSVSSSLDLDVVLQSSVHLIHERLGFYGVNIFTIDTQAHAAVLSAAAGSGAPLLDSAPFRLPLEPTSLVGATATTGHPRFIQDVRAEPMYLENLLLPDTRSEATVPLLVDKTVIGVLDVQSKQPGTFSEEMIRLLTGLADQVAIGVHNAQLYARQRQTADDLAAANQRLQELDQVKSQFMQNVSHELRTPLALIQGYAEALESGMLGDLQEQQQQATSIISRRARVLGELVGNITALLEVEAQVMTLQPVQLDGLARDTLDDFQALAQQSQLVLDAQIAPDLPPVMGEESHLRRVLDNLIGNAIKFTPRGGQVNVRLFREDGRICVQVDDTGIGIPADKVRHVFDRFYQVDGSIRRRYGGTGLGLALVKEIVTAHGGQIVLQSEPERGSSFRVSIPIRPSD